MPLPGRSLPGPRSTVARLRVLLTPSTRLAPAVALVLAVVFLIVEGVLVVLLKQVDPRAPVGVFYAVLMGLALVGNFWAGVAAVNAAAADRRREAELAAELAHLMLRAGNLQAAADVAARELAAALGLRFARVELGSQGGAAGDRERGAIALRVGDEALGVLKVPDDMGRHARQRLLRIVPTFEALLAAARESESIRNRLTESRETIERFFELSSDLMVISDQGNLLKVNPAFERTLGYTVDELAPAPFDLVPVEDRDRLREPIRQLSGDGAPVRFENRATSRDGSPRWIEWSIAPHQGLFYAVGRDVTEQRRKQEELRQTQTMLEASRDALVALAEQQASLRRIATLVAQGVSPDEVFRAVAEEMGRCLRVAGAAVSRFDDDGLVLLALAPVPSDFKQEVPLRARCPLDGDNVATRVFATGRPARMDSDEDATGVFGDVCRAMGVRCVIGVPIVVGDRVWGMASAGALGDEPMPADTEERIADFTDLVGTAIASAAGREELQASRDTLGDLAEHQAGLRRVATLVAQGGGPVEVFEAVYYEMARCVHATSAALCRYEDDQTAAVLAARHDPGMQALTVGSAVAVDADRILAAVCSTGQPAREDDPEAGAGTALGVPVVVDGRVWGAISAASPGPEPLPSDTETRFADFADLVATAVANTAAREQLDASRDRLRQLARQQTGLRRVAELIAREAEPADVFNSVAAEMADSLDVVNAIVLRYEGVEFVVEAMARIEPEMPNKPVVGERFPMDGTHVVAMVRNTGRPARLDNMEDTTGPAADRVRELGMQSVVGVPIVVGGQLWGAALVASLTGPLPTDTEARVANFADLASTAIANAATRAQLQASRDDLRELAQQQTALRRVAELIAREAEPAEVFNAVAEEMAGCLDAYNATVARFEGDDVVILALGRPEVDLPNPPVVVGERYPLDGDHTAVIVKRTGRAARLDSHQDAKGAGAARIRDIGIESMVAVPISVGRDLWGVAAVASRTGPLAADTEARIADFADLVATAIANAATRDQLQTSRDTLRDLARHQTALRRVAELVAREAEPRQVFTAVAEETAGCLDVYNASVGRFDDDAIVIEALGRAEPELPNPPSIGERFPLSGDHIGPVIRRTGRPYRMDSHDDAAGASAARIRDIGVRCMVGVPITLGGHVWGVLAAASRNDPLPPDIEARMADFADLVGTSLANAATRAELQASRDSLSQLARQQTALRRVAEIVAREAEPAEVFNAVAEQIGECLDVYNTTVIRFEGDSLVVEAVGRADALAYTPVIGERYPLDGDHVGPMVMRTGRPARIDSHERAAGSTAALIRDVGIQSMVAVPVLVGGHVWGAVGAASQSGPLPPDTEVRMADFADLVGTSIANAVTRSELQASRDSLRELADNLSVLARQQAALRRVATLVAQGVSQSEVFSAVAEEMADCLDLGGADVFRYEDDGAAIVVVASHAPPGVPHLSVGERLTTEGDNVSGKVFRTGKAARVDSWEGAGGTIAERVRELGFRSCVGAPIVVDERVWGMAGATTRADSLPPDTEARIAEFAELVATAIAAATTRAELIASRARIVAAADDARRRLERDIHDGAQQRIVSLGLKLRLAEESMPPGSDDLKHELGEAISGLTDVFTELQELSRGIHPAILSTGGLSAAFKTLARRSSVPVNLDLGIGCRLPESVEVAAYYVVAEALTNAAKHAQASEVIVRAHTTEESLHLLISDDGVGGADSAKGSGLIGLKDRIEVLGGRMRVASPTGGGTLFDITIPYHTNNGS